MALESFFRVFLAVWAASVCGEGAAIKVGSFNADVFGKTKFSKGEVVETLYQVLSTGSLLPSQLWAGSCLQHDCAAMDKYCLCFHWQSSYDVQFSPSSTTTTKGLCTPINMLPHPPPIGLHRGLTRGFDARFSPRGGEFDSQIPYAS